MLYKEAFGKNHKVKKDFSLLRYYNYQITTLSVVFQMVTIYLAHLVDLTSSATHDLPRDKSRVLE